MGNHGVLVIGKDVAETFNRLFYSSGRPRSISGRCRPGKELRVLPDEVAEKTAQEWESYPGNAEAFLREIKLLLDEEGSSYAQ